MNLVRVIIEYEKIAYAYAYGIQYKKLVYND